MLVKTRAGLADAVGKAVRAAHSYTTPCIMVVPVEQVDPDYHRWIVAETSQ
jgi:periplasmic divalent cation tolerance protein